MKKIAYLFKDVSKCVIIGIIISLAVTLISGGTGYITYKSENSLVKRDLKQGMGGKDVKKLQNLLRKGGYFPSSIAGPEGFEANGSFNEKTGQSVQLFQDANGFQSTGELKMNEFQYLIKQLRLYNRVKNALYYVSVIGLMLSAAFFISREGTKPLLYNDEWKQHFGVLNLAFVIVIISLVVGFAAMIFQTFMHLGGF